VKLHDIQGRIDGRRLVAPLRLESPGEAHSQLGGLLFRLGKADQLLGHG
jgi:hypothetical protein